MAIGFGISVLYVALVSGIWTWEFLWRLPWTVLCAFGGAAVGKWFGLVTARIRLHREIDMLVGFQATLPALKV